MIWNVLSWLDRRSMRRRGGCYNNTLNLYGTYRCSHRSHRWSLRCLRPWAMDQMCGKHWVQCYSGCSS